jgi:hypothetical protein
LYRIKDVIPAPYHPRMPSFQRKLESMLVVAFMTGFQLALEWHSESE